MDRPGVWEDKKVSWDEIDEAVAPYHLHELQLRSLSSQNTTPGAVESDEWLVVNFAVPSLDKNNLVFDRLALLLSRDKAVTLHDSDMVIMKSIEERIELRPRLAESSTGFLSIVADVVTEQFAPVLDEIDVRVDKMEDIMVRRPKDAQLHQLFTYKKMLLDFRKVVNPTTALLDALSDGRYDLVDKKFAKYLSDSYDYSKRAHELIDSMRDLISSSLDTYLTVVSNKMNDVMKRLTLISSIFLPISFLVGFGGMNFQSIPFSSDIALVVMIAFIVCVPIGMILYFKRKNWL